MSRINGFVGRRNLLKLLGVGSAGIAATAAGSVLLSEDKAVAEQQSTPVKKSQPVSPDAAIKRLVEGNQRFV
ncbi:MAG: carbonic anhydrase, partial [Tolypothrix sp. Co-bin9]|nr:carbonic anhydrase [Tolypothrix sp. Co-bin9]